jgi:hypothetical protein
MLSERQAAVEAILRAGHIPAGMELFAAGDESQLETIRRWIDESDVFMLILGGRYGSIEPKASKSYIELEYQYAAENQKPLFAAVVDEKYLDEKVKAHGKAVIEQENGHLLRAFRERVTAKTCRFFTDLNELKLIAFESLAAFADTEELSGWIRGSDVIDPKSMLKEAERLQGENADLRKRISQLEAEAGSRIEARGASVSAVLSRDAGTLLIGAKANQGRFRHVHHLGASALLVGNDDFITVQTDERQAARWSAAVQELRGHALIEAVASSGGYYRLTNCGYEVADELERTEAK